MKGLPMYEYQSFGFVTVAVDVDGHYASILCQPGWDEGYEGQPCPDWDAACSYLHSVAGNSPVLVDHSEWVPTDTAEAFVARW